MTIEIMQDNQSWYCIFFSFTTKKELGSDNSNIAIIEALQLIRLLHIRLLPKAPLSI